LPLPIVTARLAVFDVDGTLLDGDSHVLLIRSLLADSKVPLAVRGDLVATAIGYGFGLVTNPRLKASAARAFAGRTVEEVRVFARDLVTRSVLPKLRPALMNRVRAERAQGRTIVLLSASLEPFVHALREQIGADHVIAACLASSNGVLSGLLDGDVPFGDAKARLLSRLAADLGADLSRSSGYGDHHSDRAFLELVGEPYAVAPDAALGSHARLRGWPILQEGGPGPHVGG
jgi:HAD superfamily hydrolase (TIGR01490 family)